MTVEDFENKVTSDVFLRYTASLTGNQVGINKFSFSKRLCKYFGLKTVQKKIDGKVYGIFVRA